MRPMYETAADLTREQEVVDFLNEHWRSTSAKLPIRYGLDYLFDSKVKRASWFVEIKCRPTVTRAEVPFFILSASKVVVADNYLRSLNAQTMFVFAFMDGEICYIPLSMVPREVSIGGRKDRGDPQDIEPIVKIQSKHLVRIRQAPCTR